VKLEVATVGNSTRVMLSKELPEKLRIGKSDSLYVTKTQTRVELNPFSFLSLLENIW